VTETGNKTKEARADENDRELMRRYLSGDSSSFELIYQLYAGRVYGYLLAKLKRREEADEVFQAVFLKFHRARAQYDPKYPLLQWLFVISRSVLMDHYRKQSRQVSLADDIDLNTLPEDLSQNTPSPALSDQETRENMLSQLKPDQKEVVTLRVLDDLSYAQIAEKLGRSQDSIRQTFSRAIKKLKINRGSP
jgi:RNA polymerase sigma-70 factor (ECF subfamily)